MIHCDVYHTTKPRTAVFVLEGTDLASLPAELHSSLGPLTKWKTITTGPTMIAADPQQIEQDIQRQGYSVGSWQITTTTTEKPQ